MIKNIWNDNKLLENRLEEIQNETSKSSKIQFVEKSTITNRIQIISQDVNVVEEKNMLQMLSREITL